MRQVIVMVAILAFCSSVQAEDVHVRGYVLDTQHKALKGAEVILYGIEPGRQIKKPVDSKGYYDVSVPKGTALTVVYRHPTLGAVSISEISGQNDHDISKIVPPNSAAAAKSKIYLLDMIQAVESITLLASENKETGPWLLDVAGTKQSLGIIDEIVATLPRDNFNDYLVMRLGMMKNKLLKTLE